MNIKLPEVHCLLLVSDNFPEFNDVLVFQLSKNLDFSDSSDGKTFLLVFESHFLECQQFSRLNVQLRWGSGLVHLTIGSLSDLREYKHYYNKDSYNPLGYLVDDLVHVHTALAPVAAVLCHGPGLHLVDHDGLPHLLDLVTVLLGVNLGQGQTHDLGALVLRWLLWRTLRSTVKIHLEAARRTWEALGTALDDWGKRRGILIRRALGTAGV